MKKIQYTWKHLESAAESIIVSMYQDLWKPDYIVGITRGGLPLATVISHRISVPMCALHVDLKSNPPEVETNCWLSEWALGYNHQEETGITGARWDPSLRRNILVVNDFNNSGATIEWIKQDWQSSCFPQETQAWQAVWHNTVRFAAMTNNLSSNAATDYSWAEINSDDPELVYPWENK